jgi:hypothetical protein
MVGEGQKLVDMIVQRKKNWIGHVLRGDGLLREVIEGKMEGRKPREWPRMGMLEELKEDSSFVNTKCSGKSRRVEMLGA